MPIDFDCACGRHFRVGDGFAGKRTKCPACGDPLTVPTPPEAEPTPTPRSDEDAAYHALLESPDTPSAPTFSAALPRDERPQSAPARSEGRRAAAGSPKPPKPRKEPRARHERDRQQPAADRLWRPLYLVGGVALMIGGGAVCYFAINEGISIRLGVIGFLAVFSGINVFFKGVSGKLQDDD
ncbi:MAG: hypothetical protein K2V38_21225 [Gemmataceae bacterium]|nr:hypothetical protein [Gemmataceae bacterium]